MISELKSIFKSEEINLKSEFIEILVSNKNLYTLIKELKSNEKFSFNQLIDITAIDYPSRQKRFEVVYIFLSMIFNQRVVVKTHVEEGGAIESITPIHISADWFERECYDLFGIEFLNHPDLRRILTDYNFEGHPLRKDFPLTGHTEVRYDELEKKVIYEPVKLAQEYRNLDYASPWEGIPNTLSGDEKVLKDDDEGN
ncbi:MAG: NADH-quinone oxidoreductase subunit C [Rickettsiales bacterium]|nr:NADH-quinone oxidoreductase subunit C [Rickettsiales bacterium]|tara:strand:+ start:1010 stop:1603 length:594 start_codon:yes stop_codon:yes gene_type:complete